MNSWIPIKELMPEKAIPVLICNPHWDYPVVASYAGCGVWMDTWRQKMTYSPTHWLPFPEIPGGGGSIEEG